MEIPNDLITYSVVGAVGLLLGNTWKLQRISWDLSTHIKEEGVRDADSAKQLSDIKKKLPNGEVEETFKMVRRLFNYYEAEIAEWEGTREEVEAAIREKEEHGV